MFTSEDFKDIESRGLTIEQVKHQLQNFKNGFPFVNLSSAATLNNGISYFSESDIEKYIDKYQKSLQNVSVLKFVPASGAASRMFKSLFGFIELYKGNKSSYEDFMSAGGLKDITDFILRIKDFAFYNDLKQKLAEDDYDIERLVVDMNYEQIIDYLLNEKGLNYGNLPKALLKFHKYGGDARTPVEEHLVEGAYYAKNNDNSVNIHLTLSDEHQKLFKEHVLSKCALYEKVFGVTYNIQSSIQHSNTDIIAVDMNNKPFRTADGKLLFRQGGHGALINNLNELDADLIFIKNIDNVLPDQQKHETIKYKKLLAGVLLEVKEKVFYFQKKCDTNYSDDLFDEVKNYYKEVFSFSFATEINNKKEYLTGILHRPLRVCGMVKNEGEPGGGPYFVQHQDGSVSLQIIESSQIDQNDPEQLAIMKNATHFNPVDLVCYVKDYKGQKFNLPDFVDHSTGFISKKSKNGRDLKAQELPGLWNGAMAYWNTVFIEVPLSTFSPVKTVMDLLRSEHQS